MSELLPALGQIGALVVLLALTVPLLARYLATVYTSERHLGVERAAYRVLRVDPDTDQHWRSYAMSVLGFSLVGILLLFGLGRLQQHLPLSLGFPALPTEGAWNTAVSFVTNTNWQWYSGEAAVGHLMQMSGLTVQNFVSAGVGMAVAAAFARGIARRECRASRSCGRSGARATSTSTTTCGCAPPSCAASSRTTRPGPGTCSRPRGSVPLLQPDRRAQPFDRGLQLGVLPRLGLHEVRERLGQHVQLLLGCLLPTARGVLQQHQEQQ